jgi:hypothetical protein
VTPPERLRRLVYRAHLAHHDNPNAVDNFFASLWLSVPVVPLYFLFSGCYLICSGRFNRKKLPRDGLAMLMRGKSLTCRSFASPNQGLRPEGAALPDQLVSRVTVALCGA